MLGGSGLLLMRGSRHAGIHAGILARHCHSQPCELLPNQGQTLVSCHPAAMHQARACGGVQGERRGGGRRHAGRGGRWGGRCLSQPRSLLLEHGLSHVVSHWALARLGHLREWMGWQ